MSDERNNELNHEDALPSLLLQTFVLGPFETVVRGSQLDILLMNEIQEKTIFINNLSERVNYGPLRP